MEAYDLEIYSASSSTSSSSSSSFSFISSFNLIELSRYSQVWGPLLEHGQSTRALKALKKADSFSPRSYQVTVAPQVGVGLHATSSLHAGILPGVSFHRSFTGAWCLNYCGLLCNCLAVFGKDEPVVIFCLLCSPCPHFPQ